MTVSWADVLKLVEQLDASALADAEVVTDGVHVRVSRTTLTPPPASQQQQPQPLRDHAVPARPPTPAASGTGPVVTGPVVTAPMLGVLYHRPAPDQPAFVQVGDTVTPETTVAIIEVMKLMNPVTAGVGGVVAEVCVPDGTMVEHGDVLFRLQPMGEGSGLRAQA